MIRDIWRASEPDNRVIPFRPRWGRRNGTLAQYRLPKRTDGPLAADLSKYESDQETTDDYRHRMRVNGIAFVFNVILIAFGVWLATNIPR